MPPPLRSDPLTTRALSVKSLEEGDHERLAKIHFNILKGHSDSVTTCHFCFDDTKIISGSYDSTVKLWDVDHRVPIQTFQDKHTGPISECCLSPDNKRLITASYDKTLKAWDTETGKMLHNHMHVYSEVSPVIVNGAYSWWSLEQDGLLTSCHISHDGKYVVSGSDMENALFICDAVDAKQVAFIKDHHRSTVRRCRFDPHNQRIATVSSDMSIKFWDIIAQSTTITIEQAHANAIADCCFSSDGHYLCTAAWDETLKLWDVRTGEFRSHGPILLEQGHIGIVGCCDLSKDGSLVVSGGYDKTIAVWDSSEAYKKISLKGHKDWVTDIAISGDKKKLVSSSKDCTLRLWNIENANEIPVVIEAIKTRGSKLATCEECEKPFLTFQNNEDKLETKCIFCRLASQKKSVLPVPPPLAPDL